MIRVIGFLIFLIGLGVSNLEAQVMVLANEATQAERRAYFHCVDATDGITPETGEAGGQPQVSSNGAAWTNTGIGTLVSIGNGRYYANLTQTLVQTAGTWIETRYKSANTAECPGSSVQVTGFDPHDGVRAGLTALPNAAAEASGGLFTRGTGAGQINQTVNGLINTNLIDIAGSAVSTGAAQLGVNVVNLGGAAVQQAGGYIKVSEGTGTGQLDLTSGRIGIDWAKVSNPTSTVTLSGTSVDMTRTGTAQAGATASITLDAGASAVTDYYKNQLVQIISGTGAGQSRFISGYNGTTKVATVTSNWATTPGATSVFVLRAFDSVPATVSSSTFWDELTASHTTAGTFGKAVGDTLAAVDTEIASIDSRIPSALSSGRMVANAQAISDSTAAADNVEANIGNLNATVSSRASQTSVDTANTNINTIDDFVDTEVTAIKTKTDQLTFTVSNKVDSTPSGIAVRKNTAYANFMLKMVLASDNKTPATGLTVTPTRSIDGGAFGGGTLGGSGAVTQVGSGWYKINIPAADLNGDEIILRFDGGGTANITEFKIRTQN